MDSNHRMSESKSDALTGLGEGAIYLAACFCHFNSGLNASS